MTQPRDTVQVNIEYFTGQEEGDVGYPYYVASCDDLMVTTDGATFEELLKNIRECLTLCLVDTDSIAEFDVLPSAKVRLVMETYPQ